MSMNTVMPPKTRGKKRKEEELEDNELEQLSFCKGVTAFILPAGLAKLQRGVLAKQLEKFGGTHTETIRSASHVIVSKSLTKLQISRGMKETCPEGVVVVTSDWLSACIMAGEKKDEKPYLVNLTDNATRCLDHASNIEDVPCSSASPANKVISIGEPEVTACGAASTWTEPLVEGHPDDTDKGSPYFDSGDEGDMDMINRLTAAKEKGSIIAPGPSVKTDQWTCSQASSKKCHNFNTNITEKLEVLAKAYTTTQDTWRAFGYKKAIAVIAKHPKRIDTKEEVESLRCVGSRLAEKIWEIVQTGHLRRLDHLGPSIATLNLFADVWGAGPKTAETWMAMGFKSLQDLNEKATLTSQQKIGLRYYDEFLERMPRTEVEAIENEVRRVAEAVKPGFDVVTCGSYRRGRDTCGDIDILISHRDGTSHAGILQILLCNLKEEGLISDDLTSVSNDAQAKYMGVFILPGKNRKHRRIDIIVAPQDEFPCALVHFTGSGHLNRSMRHLAATKGMSLSEHALNTGVVRKGKEKVCRGVRLPVKCEREVFEHLGLDYLEPTDRDW